MLYLAHADAAEPDLAQIRARATAPLAAALGVLLILVLIPLTLMMRSLIVRISGQQA